MVDTFLFDLDGTLLPLNMDEFMKVYFNEMGKVFHDIIEPKKLVNNVWQATYAMISNKEEKTNEEVFMENFKELINGDLKVYKERFDRFYDEGFLNVRSTVMELPIIKKSIDILKEKGYQLVIATNPIFPKKAIYHRIKWAGLNIDDFSYISHYEKNHYCKPQVEYYREILKDIKKSPCQCIMVGNDVQEDMVASVLGIKTFLVTDCMINRTGEEFQSTYKGSYEEFYEFVKNLDPVKGQPQVCCR